MPASEAFLYMMPYKVNIFGLRQACSLSPMTAFQVAFDIPFAQGRAKLSEGVAECCKDSPPNLAWAFLRSVCNQEVSNLYHYVPRKKETCCYCTCVRILLPFVHAGNNASFRFLCESVVSIDMPFTVKIPDSEAPMIARQQLALDAKLL